MVYGAQYGAVRPSGMKKKRGRMAPIIEEQAKQGLATKMVTAGKAKAQADEQWQFEQDARTSELKMQKKQLKLAKKQQKYGETMDWVKTGIGALSTGLEVIDMFSSWF